jgi:hypothetical protein
MHKEIGPSVVAPMVGTSAPIALLLLPLNLTVGIWARPSTLPGQYNSSPVGDHHRRAFQPLREDQTDDRRGACSAKATTPNNDSLEAREVRRRGGTVPNSMAQSGTALPVKRSHISQSQVGMPNLIRRPKSKPPLSVYPFGRALCC